MALLTSPCGNVEYPKNVSLSKYVMEKWATEYAERVALINVADDIEITYKELNSRVLRTANYLQKKGVKKGDVVLIFSPNHIHYPVVFHALGLLGAIPSTCNPLYKTDELRRQIHDCCPVAIFLLENQLKVAEEAIENYDGLSKGIILLDREPTVDKYTTMNEVLATTDEHVDEVEIDPVNDTAVIPYSSGTTGWPKGVLARHRSFIFCCEQFNHAQVQFLSGVNDVCIGVVPYYHILGMAMYLGYAMRQGATNCLMERFVPDVFFKSIEKYKVTFLAIAPPLAVFMAKHPLVDQIDMTSLRFVTCGGAALGKSVIQDVCKRINLKHFGQLYGMTECLLACNESVDRMEPGSVGVISPAVECKVVDVETGALLGANQEGEILIRSDGVMIGYLNNPEATKDTLDDEGFIHTGDIGYFNDNGFFYIVDRIKDLIKYNAYQVAPAELEDILLSHSAIADAAVVGLPDETCGELPRAIVVLKSGQKVMEEEIIDYMNDRVAPQKKLRGGVEFRTSIPKLPSGKILRRVLRQEMTALLEQKKNANN